MHLAVLQTTPWRTPSTCLTKCLLGIKLPRVSSDLDSVSRACWPPCSRPPRVRTYVLMPEPGLAVAMVTGVSGEKARALQLETLLVLDLDQRTGGERLDASAEETKRCQAAIYGCVISQLGIFSMQLPLYTQTMHLSIVLLPLTTLYQ